MTVRFTRRCARYIILQSQLLIMKQTDDGQQLFVLHYFLPPRPAKDGDETWSGLYRSLHGKVLHFEALSSLARMHYGRTATMRIATMFQAMPPPGIIHHPSRSASPATKRSASASPSQRTPKAPKVPNEPHIGHAEAQTSPS
jgi:hypothetical protein